MPEYLPIPFIIPITGRAVEKLVDALRAGIGALAEPALIRRRARAESDAAVIRAEGEVKVVEEWERAEARLIYQEARRQRSIEAIASGAAKLLPEKVSEEPVQADWVARFLDACEDVGDEQMQSIWSQILAGEVERPGSYSYRALEAVKLMSQRDAELFTNFCGCTWTLPPAPGPVNLTIRGMDLAVEMVCGIELRDALHLAGIGLLLGTPDLHPTFPGEFPNYGPIELLFFGQRYRLTPAPPKQTERMGFMVPVQQIDMRPLSVVGQELFRICGPTPNQLYLDAFAAAIARHGHKLEKLG